MADNTKKSSNKVFDISTKTSAAPNSRPVIVGHGPLMQDPTIVTEDNKESPEEQSINTKHKINIQPLNPGIKPEEDDSSSPKVSENTPDEEQKEPTKISETKPEPSVPKLDITQAKEDSNKQNSDLNASSPSEDKKLPNNTKNEPKKSDNIAQTENEQKKAEEEAAAKSLEHAQHINDLVSSEKYFLPINQVEKKRNKRMVFLGTIICVILAIAWVDVALDAGIISNSYKLPHTHFFSLKPISSLATATKPTAPIKANNLTQTNKTIAQSAISEIGQLLSVYFTNNNSYPEALSASQLTSQSGLSSSSVKIEQNIFTPPSGVAYVYNPSPKGCTTKAKTCVSYNLKAVDLANNTTIASTSQ